MGTLALLEWLRRFGLAAVCVIGPFVLVNLGIDFAVGLLVKHQREALLRQQLWPSQSQSEGQKPSTDVLPRGFAYKLRDTALPDAAPDAKPGEKKSAPETEILELYARHIAGRYSFSIANGFVYVVSLFAVLFASVVIWQRAGWKGVAIVAALSAALASYVTRNVEAFPYARTLVMDGIFAAADRNSDLELQLINGESTATSVNWLMKIGTFIGFVFVGMLSGGIVLAAVGPPSPAFADLKRRLFEIRVALVL